MPCSDRRGSSGSRPRGRRGFTMAELMVAVLIALNVLVILWQVFVADQRRFSRDQGKLSSMQSGLLFAERLEGDLREIALLPPDATMPDKPFTLDQPFTFADSFRRISFLKFAPSDKSNTPLVPVEQIDYAYDAAQHKMIRGVNGQNGWIRNLLVDSIVFEPKWVKLDLTSLALTPPPPVFRPDLPIYLLKYQITASPETPGSKGPADVAPENKFTLVNSVPILYRAERTNHPYWIAGGSDQLVKP